MSKTLLILILTICLIINFATCQDAMLLVYKSVKENEAVVNKNVAFTITVYNVGQSAAYDVTVEDVAPPEMVVVGDVKTTFERVDPGKNVSYSYSIVPRSVGSLDLASAVVSYKNDPEDDRRYYGRAAVIPQISVLTQSQYNKKHNSSVDYWAVFVLLSMIPVGIPGMVYLYANNQVQQVHKKKV